MRKVAYNNVFIIVCTVTFLISPVLSIPFIVLGLKRRYYSSFFYYALVLATFAYIMLPVHDLFRHSQNYYHWEGVPFSQIKFADIMMNGVITYVEWFMVNNKIPFEYLRFFEIIISLLLTSKIFNYLLNCSESNYSTLQYVNRLLIFLLFFDFFYTAVGVRFGFALCFYLYGVHELIEKNSKLKCSVFVIIAGLIHLSFIFLAPVSFILYNLKLKKYQALISIIILFFIFGFLISKFAYLLGPRAEWYFKNTEGGAASYGGMTLWGIIGFFLPKIASIPFIVILFRYYDNKNGWNRISISWLVIAAVSIVNPVLFYRIIWVFMAMGIYLILSKEHKLTINRSMINFAVIGGLLFTSVNFVMYSAFVLRSPLLTRVILPVPFIFSMNSQYDSQWIINNITPEGSYRR